MDEPDPQPLLTRSWDAAVIGWIVVCGAMVAVLVAGTVTNEMATAVAAPALAFPVTVAAVFAIVQWLQVRSSAAARPSWWHMAGVAAALFVWLAWPAAPGVLEPAKSARAACIILQGDVTAQCLHRAAAAMDNRNLAWWLSGGVILTAALLARRSRIAAWAAIPAAFAGSVLAGHFLGLLIRSYHPGG